MSGVINDLIVGRCGDVANGGPAEDDARTWAFARSVLTDALVTDSPAGIHDVTVEREGAYLVVTLTSPDGSARVRFVRQALLRFAMRTQNLVPLGDESRHMAATIDAAVARLLGGVR